MHGTALKLSMAHMRIFAALLAAVLLLGVAPVAVAAGLCAEESCCRRTDTNQVAAPDCCGAIVCSNDAPDELVGTEKANIVAALAPVKSAEAAIVRPPSELMRVPARVRAKSGAERLSSLSILLI